MFEKIIPLAATKRQQSKLAKLQKSFKPTRKDNLADLQFLIYDFFIAENQEAYQACLEIMEKIGFPDGGEALQWPFIEPAYWLKYYLAEAADKETIHNYLFSIMTKNWPDHRTKKWLDNMLSDETIRHRKAKYSQPSNTPLEKYEWGLSLLKDHLMQLTYKPSDDPTRASQISEIEALVAELKQQFQKINKFI